MQLAKSATLVIVCMAVTFSGASQASSTQDDKPMASTEAASGLNKADAIHDQLRALREEFIEAVNAKNYDALIALLHPEVILTAQDGKNLSLIRRQDGVRKYLDRLLVAPGHGVESMKLNPKVDDLSVIYQDNTAIAFGSSLDHYKLANGTEFDLKTRWSVTVIKEGEKWLLANIHVSTNLFENPVLATVSRMAIWLSIGSGFVFLVVGLFAGRLRSRSVNG